MAVKVSELIAHLQTLPQDAVVLYRCMSDYAELENEFIDLKKGKKGKIICHHGHYMQAEEHWFDPNYPGYPYGKPNDLPSAPKYVTAVVFPGN